MRADTIEKASRQIMPSENGSSRDVVHQQKKHCIATNFRKRKNAPLLLLGSEFHCFSRAFLLISFFHPEVLAHGIFMLDAGAAGYLQHLLAIIITISCFSLICITNSKPSTVLVDQSRVSSLSRLFSWFHEYVVLYQFMNCSLYMYCTACIH